MSADSPDDPVSEPPAGGVAFGHFVVPRREDGSLWKLGEGNMGVTYRAFDTSLRVEVALKVITASRVNEEQARRRFQREARAAARIRHPNIASVLYLGEEGGEFFYAMEFVPGTSLDALLKANVGPLPPVVAVALAAQVAAALNAAHKKEVVHRDLKPANLMLLEGDRVDQEDARTEAAGHRQIKVIDFGLARSFSAERGDDSMVTQTVSGFIGTPAYSSPEQAINEDHIDGRSDLYSLGIILWQMLAGNAPFRGPVMDVMRQHLLKPPPLEQLPAGLPDSLAKIVTGLLVKEAGQRTPQTAGELRNALDACLQELTTVPPPVRPETANLGTGGSRPSEPLADSRKQQPAGTIPTDVGPPDPNHPGPRSSARSSHPEPPEATPPQRRSKKPLLIALGLLALLLVVASSAAWWLSKPRPDVHSAGQKPSDERTSAAKAASAHEDLVARERSDARAAEIRAKEAEVDKCKQQIASLTKQSSQLDELKGSELINAVSQMQHIDPSLDKILPKYQENVSTEAQLLNSGLGPNHPKIKSLNAERGVYMQQITDRILSIRRSLAIQLQIARNTAETLDTQLKKLRTEPDTASQDR